MRQKKTTITDETGGVNSDPLMLNWRARPFAVSLAFNTSGNTSGFTVQFALDDPQVTPQASWKWFNHSEMASMKADETGNLAFPVTAIRLVSDGGGSDIGTLYVIQAGG